MKEILRQAKSEPPSVYSISPGENVLNGVELLPDILFSQESDQENDYWSGISPETARRFGIVLIGDPAQ